MPTTDIFGARARILLALITSCVGTMCKAQPVIEWLDPAGPWASGPATAVTHSRERDPSHAVNSFRISGVEGEVTIRLHAQGSIFGVPNQGNPVAYQYGVSLDVSCYIAPGQLEGASYPWTPAPGMIEVFHRSDGSPVVGHLHSEFGPEAFDVRLQAGQVYTIGIWNLSYDNFFDIGHYSSVLEVSVDVDPPADGPDVLIGSTSWDWYSLQSVLDAEYGVGSIDVRTDYEGFAPGDADPVWWEDVGIHSILVREIAGFSTANRFGWYEETLNGAPMIDGVGDGVIFSGPMGEGSETVIQFPAGTTRFGFYLDPGSSCNAPIGERFFTNRMYNDVGPDGSGALHFPFDGDMQCLVYNISDLRGGNPTYVLAWEDLDSGSQITSTYTACGTDNDFNDLVVEISAFSPVKVESSSFGAIKAMFDE